MLLQYNFECAPATEATGEVSAPVSYRHSKFSHGHIGLLDGLIPSELDDLPGPGSQDSNQIGALTDSSSVRSATALDNGNTFNEPDESSGHEEKTGEEEDSGEESTEENEKEDEEDVNDHDEEDSQEGEGENDDNIDDEKEMLMSKKDAGSIELEATVVEEEEIVKDAARNKPAPPMRGGSKRKREITAKALELMEQAAFAAATSVSRRSSGAAGGGAKVSGPKRLSPPQAPPDAAANDRLSSTHGRQSEEDGRKATHGMSAFFTSSSSSSSSTVAAKKKPEQLLPQDGRTKPLRPCPLCGKGCSGGAALANHIKTHGRQASFVPVAAVKKIAAAAKIPANARLHAGEYDGGSAEHEASASTYSTHMQFQKLSKAPKQTTKKSIFPCSLCGKEFMGSIALMNHIEQQHSSSNGSNSSGDHLLSASTRMEPSHGAKSVLLCEICGKECVGGAALANHIKTHGRQAFSSTSSSACTATGAGSAQKATTKRKMARKANVMNPSVNANNSAQHPKHCDGFACHCQHSRVTVHPILVKPAKLLACYHAALVLICLFFFVIFFTRLIFLLIFSLPVFFVLFLLSSPPPLSRFRKDAGRPRHDPRRVLLHLPRRAPPRLQQRPLEPVRERDGGRSERHAVRAKIRENQRRNVNCWWCLGGRYFVVVVVLCPTFTDSPFQSCWCSLQSDWHFRCGVLHHFLLVLALQQNRSPQQGRRPWPHL